MFLRFYVCAVCIGVPSIGVTHGLYAFVFYLSICMTTLYYRVITVNTIPGKPILRLPCIIIKYEKLICVNQLGHLLSYILLTALPASWF